MSNPAKIFICGDFCSTPSTEYIQVSEKLSTLIQSCDIRVCNLESPVLPNKTKPVAGRIHQSENVPKFLSKLGFNLVTIANNHTFDYGEEGYAHTVSLLRNNGIEYLGAGNIKEAYRLKTIEINRLKIGFLAFSFAGRTEKIDEWKEAGKGCAYINSLKVPHIIEDAKKKVDFLVVLPHDGIEYIDIPLPETILRYRDFIDSGADIVVGAHPHCPQGWEIYRNKPIFYSLGNFFFNSKTTPDFVAKRPYWYNGLALILSVNENSLEYEYINTINIRNRQLDVDNTLESQEHTRILNDLLNDKTKYESELKKIVERDGFLRLKNLAAYYRSMTFTFVAKFLVANLVRSFRRGFYNIEQSTYLYGDTERNLILRYLNSLKDKN